MIAGGEGQGRECVRLIIISLEALAVAMYVCLYYYAVIAGPLLGKFEWRAVSVAEVREWVQEAASVRAEAL